MMMMIIVLSGSDDDDDDDDDDDTIGRPLQILNTSRHSALKIFNNSA